MKQAMLLIFALIVISFSASAQTEKKEEPKPLTMDVKQPKRFLFSISDSMGLVAFKRDTVSAWVVIDSASTLATLLDLIERNYKREQADKPAAQKPK